MCLVVTNLLRSVLSVIVSLLMLLLLYVASTLLKITDWALLALLCPCNTRRFFCWIAQIHTPCASLTFTIPLFSRWLISTRKMDSRSTWIFIGNLIPSNGRGLLLLPDFELRFRECEVTLAAAGLLSLTEWLSEVERFLWKWIEKKRREISRRLHVCNTFPWSNVCFIFLQPK